MYLEWLPDIYDKVFFAKIENDYFCKNLYHRRLGQMFETFILCGTLFLKKKKKGLTQVKIHIKVCCGMYPCGQLIGYMEQSIQEWTK